MTSVPSTTASFSPVDVDSMPLAPRLAQLLSSIEDPVLAAHVTGTVRLCLGSLREIGRIHLPQDHFEDGAEQRADDDRYLELAPYILTAVASINRLLAQMAETYPAPPEQEDSGDDDFDFDLEFDLVDGPEGDGGLSSGKSNVADRSAMSEPEQVADAAHAYGSMLRSRVVEFGGRIRAALSLEDSWALLSELDDYNHRLTKAVQGLLFGILSVFTSDAKREEILPEYRSAVGESVALRGAIAHLSYHISRFNTALADTDAETAVPLLVGVADRLARFAARPQYRMLRAEDKKATIDFRQTLHKLRHRKAGLSVGPLHRTVEGFSKFLESLSAINHREVLVLHDRKVLEESLERLMQLLGDHDDAEAAWSAVAATIEVLGGVYGRSPDLDEALRDWQPDADHGELAVELQRWLPLVQGTLAVCG